MEERGQEVSVSREDAEEGERGRRGWGNNEGQRWVVGEVGRVHGGRRVDDTGERLLSFERGTGEDRGNEGGLVRKAHLMIPF